MRIVKVSVANIAGLSDFSLELGALKSVAFAGPNGTGKSRLLTCLLAPWLNNIPPSADDSREAWVELTIDFTGTDIDATTALVFRPSCSWTSTCATPSLRGQLTIAPLPAALPSPTMPKTTRTYWNPLSDGHRGDWQPIEGLEGMAEELTLAIDEESGDYTRLTRFFAGADTTAFGSKSHEYPEEVFIVEGRLYDAAFDRWLEKGDYASRPPGEAHGPFRTDEGCLVLEISFPSQTPHDDPKT